MTARNELMHEHPGEFDLERGETQRSGDKDTLGLGRSLPPNIQVGIAPPDPLQVVSNFDTRPIGAYDFALNDTALIGGGETNVVAINFDIPDGYTAVLRNVHIEFTPPLIVNNILDATDATKLQLRLLRDNTTVPNNLYVIRGSATLIDWATHIIYGFWETMGVQFTRIGGFFAPANTRVNLTMQGTLVPTKGRDPTTELASDPLLIRTLAELPGALR